MRRLFPSLATILVINSLSAQVPNYVPSSGLVGWWPFNGNANDQSGNGNDGTPFGPTPAPDRYGASNAAYDFDGAASYITIPNIAIQGNASRSYSFWLRTGDTGSGNMVIATGSGSNQDGATFNMRLANGSQFIGFMGGNFTGCCYDYDPTGNVLLNDEVWHHVVTVYDADSLSFYVDGAFEKSTPLPIFTDGQTNYVGRSNDQTGGNEAYFLGQIDDIGVWQRALTPGEILDLFNGVDGPCVSPVTVTFSGLSSSYTLSDPSSVLVGTPVGGVFLGQGISGSNFDPAAAGVGTYGIVYTYVDTAGCVNSYAQCTEVTLNVGLVGASIATSGVRVYPNPTRGQFTVELDLYGLTSMQVFDSAGRLAHNEVFQASGLRTIRSLDLSALAKGSYSLRVQNGGDFITQTVVVE